MSIDTDSEVAKLLEIKAKYHADLDVLEAELHVRFEREETERKAVIASEYLEKLTDLFAERIKPLLMEVLKD